ncbi:InlB B-repeat-containing protein [Heyndrickxia sp. NPDC080065]|uniref:InlB B-repeat-containing protein n=1 Tax=Heyndrickxia sp. NPDC080065 TaxID=3390568 RepID=UPI003D062230
MSRIVIKIFTIFIAVVLILQCVPQKLSFLGIAKAEEPINKDHQLNEVPAGYIGIYTAEDLNEIRNNLKGKYILMKDIDLTQATSAGGAFSHNGAGWEPIGSDESPFSGVYDGNGHALKGLHITISSTQNINAGLFGYCESAEIKNLQLVNSLYSIEKINKNDDNSVLYSNVKAGGIASELHNSTIKNSSFNGVINVTTLNNFVFNSINTQTNIGGIAGFSDQSTIEQSQNSGDIIVETKNKSGDKAIRSSDSVGGIVGENYLSKMNNDINSGTVTVASSSEIAKNESLYAANIGGIEGASQQSELVGCKNTGTVQGKTSSRDLKLNVGGITGSSGDSTFNQLVNEGKVEAVDARQVEYESYGYAVYVGGVVGYVRDSTLNDCQNHGEIIGIEAGGIAGIVNGDSTLKNCENTGKIHGDSTSGGIAGSFNGSTLTKSYNSGEISGDREAGGLVGNSSGSSISDCYNTGTIHSHNPSGGISGTISYKSTISNCYNTGQIYGGSAGGVVGQLLGSTITDSFNNGKITSNGSGGGGIVGRGQDKIIIKRSYNIGRVVDQQENPIYQSGGILGGIDEELTQTNDILVEDSYYLDSSIDSSKDYAGISKSSFQEMQQKSTYKGFDFQSTWNFDENSHYSFPQLVHLPSFQDDKMITIHVKNKPDKLVYVQGEKLDLTGAVISVRTSFGNEFDVQVTPEMISGFNNNQTGNQVVRIEYKNLTTFFLVQVNPTYSVTFKDFDGKILKIDKVEEGSTAIAPENPSRKGYTFIGWNLDFSNVTYDLTITAMYEINHYTVTFKDYDGKELDTQTVNYGSPASAPNNPRREGYTFTGWDGDFSKITSDLTIIAKYDKNKYSVIFKDYDGKELNKQTVEYGSSAVRPEDPTREGYTFIGWDGDFNKVTSDQTITAKYDINKYNVIFKDYDGTELNKQTIEYGSSAVEPSEPTRKGYTFIGWDGDFSKVRSDLTVTAKYDINKYSVIFKNYDGRELNKQTIEYGSSAVKPEDPTREGYTFTGWDKDFNKVTSDLTITAKYEINKYTVVFKGAGQINNQIVKYGSLATAPNNPSKSGYTFISWYKDSNFKTKFNFKTAIKSNITLYARLEKNPEKTTNLKVTSSGYNKLKVYWKKVSGATGYEIYRATSKTGTYSKITAITSGSTIDYLNSNLTTRKTYYYKIRAYRTIDGTKAYSSYSSIVSGKPVLAKPTSIKAKKVSSTSIKVSWNKVSEASGYEIYRASSKSGSYKKVKTLTKGTTVNYTNKSLAKRKTYYYKVRTYRTVNKKKIYSSFSNIVYGKTN